MGDSSTLRFLSFSSVVDSSFWHKLCQLKLEEDKLEERERFIRGYYLHPSLCSLFVDYTSFNENYQSPFGKLPHSNIEYLCQKLVNYNVYYSYSPGYLINFNSSAKFKECNKSDLIEKYGNLIHTYIEKGDALKQPNLLNTFILITYINLKNYEFVYWFGFPVNSSVEFKLDSKPSLLFDVFDSNQINSILRSHSDLSEHNQSIFAIDVSDGIPQCITIEKYIQIKNKDPESDCYVCFLDPSSDEYPGWPLRNILLLLKHQCKNNHSTKVICLRIGASFNTSMILSGKIEYDLSENKWIGWEKNKRDKFGPRFISLQHDMDPVRLADSSADLNLKLMKWRLVPDLDLDIIKMQKCLLLGAGTLGCTVARNLLGWGVRHITFVDSGSVSFSNPVRQSLYNHKDCDLGKGAKMKAPTAAQALKDILPTVISNSVVLEIPMPGHATANMDNAMELHRLIEDHDVIFLLTDSRESRWLPTVISTVLNKITITSALGYDTYLVMRHGVKTDSTTKLGCYFCNDITAPGNSLEDRTLDQQCTVTRPGVSSMAASLAVELLVSLLQHKNKAGCDSTEETLLGAVPHSIRGFLSQFNHILPSTNSFSQCIACSTIVSNTYNNEREIFLQNVFKSTKYLEDLTGLTELHQLSETLEDLEISDTESTKETE